MNLTQISFADLPFNKLFQDYTLNFDTLSPFFQINPFSEKDIESAIHSYNFHNSRDKTVELLKQYNKQFGAGKKTIQSIEKLKREDSVAVVTGQQLTLFGGPLFTVYKILTAIHFAKEWEEKYDITCVPVFWMADEDHDYEEVSAIGLPQTEDHKTFQLDRNSKAEPRVAEIEIDERFNDFKKRVVENQFDTDFTDQLWRKFDSCYQSGTPFGTAFGKLILALFADHGILLAGTAHPAIKKHLIPTLKSAVENVEGQYQDLKDQTDELISNGYHGQVQLQPSNLFWIDGERNRIKLSYENSNWTADGADKTWSSEELINEISNIPERFSPNVFLRPIMQNELLPGFAYVAGPSEISYYGQMKKFYDNFGQKMPVIAPRFSATLIESGIDRIFDKLPFELPAYNKRIEDLESEFIEQSDSPDIEKIFESWKKDINNISESRIKKIKAIEPTLEGSSEKAIATFFNELDKLKGKVYRSVKEQEKTQLKRIRKIKNNLFPNGNLQEREVAFIYFMNKYGLNIWDDLLDLLESEKPDSHKIIRL